MVSCQSSSPLETVARVDIDRYQGKWYEIARLPQRFEEDCACVTAEYGKVEDYISVKNTCFDTIGQKWRVSEGKAFPQEGYENARLRVQFFFPFKGDYYIIDLDDDYNYALVGAPNRSYLWVLSRTPHLDQNTLDQLVATAVQKGFDTTQLIYTPQTCQENPRKS